MAKKNIKKEKEVSIPVVSEEVKTNISTLQLTNKELEIGAYARPMDENNIRDIETNPNFTNIGFAEPKKTLSNISMEELIAYKNGCEILCKHYENKSRLNSIHCHLFNKFNTYAKEIFNEIEKRVVEICNT
jgi:hypothetical protein